ncbi:hypothetical protein Bbelb_285940 [Branchiostoma belcheri]|nr:hypothetical protein Bbelb_285940 [Branchiostoma belcheri]
MYQYQRTGHPATVIGQLCGPSATEPEMGAAHANAPRALKPFFATWLKTVATGGSTERPREEPVFVRYQGNWCSIVTTATADLQVKEMVLGHDPSDLIRYGHGNLGSSDNLKTSSRR